MSRLSSAISHTLTAIGHRDQVVNQEFLESEVTESISELARKVQAVCDPSPTLEEVTAGLKGVIFPSEPAKQVVLNFGFVSLCTELEVYISHLVAAILRYEPRLMKSLASGKTLSTVEIVDSGDYEVVMDKLRDKIVKEVVDANARDMFLKHLGERFDLFSEDDFHYHTPPNESLNSRKKLPTEGILRQPWGIQDTVAAFEKRHAIVHEGQLSHF